MISSASSHVASSAGRLDHWMSHLVIAAFFFLNIPLSKTFSGCQCNRPVESMGGRFKVGVIASPIFFFNKETWKTWWILESRGRSRWYATALMRAFTWIGP
ncbi:hypothetical protein ACFX2B_043335 [Malus domestica]